MNDDIEVMTLPGAMRALGTLQRSGDDASVEMLRDYLRRGADLIKSQEAQIDALRARLNQPQSPFGSRVIELGVGKALTAHGVLGGDPVLAIMEHTGEPGVFGEKCPEKKALMEAEAIMLRFKNMAAVLHFLDLIKDMMLAFASEEDRAELEAVLVPKHPYESWELFGKFLIEMTEKGEDLELIHGFIPLWNHGDWTALDRDWPEWKAFVEAQSSSSSGVKSNPS